MRSSFQGPRYGILGLKIPLTINYRKNPYFMTLHKPGARRSSDRQDFSRTGRPHPIRGIRAPAPGSTRPPPTPSAWRRPRRKPRRRPGAASGAEAVARANPPGQWPVVRGRNPEQKKGPDPSCTSCRCGGVRKNPLRHVHPHPRTLTPGGNKCPPHFSMSNQPGT